MEIYSFTGPSGTGKSTVALYFADKYKIDAIIDDGILIINGQKKAGVSAKFEKNTVTAVRRAIFSEEEHCADVQNMLTTSAIKRLLIIGTSDKMTKKIAKRLNIGDIQHFHYLSEFRSENEMDYARFVRLTKGQHVMPLPHRQVEQNFFKRLVMKGWDIISQRGKIGETTIVRPDFQYEVIHIAPKVYMDLIRYELEKHPFIVTVDKLTVEQQTLPQFIAHITIVQPEGKHIPTELERIQRQLFDVFQQHFTFFPAQLDLHVKGVQM